MKHLIFSCIIGLLLSGCGAHMVIHPKNNKYAPTNGTGVISFGGGIFPRKDAYKKMYKACNGKYSIIREQVIDNGVIVQYNPNLNMGFAAPVVRYEIEFKCEEKNR